MFTDFFPVFGLGLFLSPSLYPTNFQVKNFSVYLQKIYIIVMSSDFSTKQNKIGKNIYVPISFNLKYQLSFYFWSLSMSLDFRHVSPQNLSVIFRNCTKNLMSCFLFELLNVYNFIKVLNMKEKLSQVSHCYKQQHNVYHSLLSASMFRNF